MVNAIALLSSVWMHLGGWLSTGEARVAFGYRFVRRSRAKQPPARINNSTEHAMAFTIC